MFVMREQKELYRLKRRQMARECKSMKLAREKSKKREEPPQAHPCARRLRTRDDFLCKRVENVR